MKSSIVLFSACLITLSIICTSCKKKSSTDNIITPIDTRVPLYQRVGGAVQVPDPTHSGLSIEKGRLTIRSVVDSSILVIAADAQLAPYFAILFAELGNNNTTGLTALSKNLTDFICEKAGSKNPEYAYAGKSMKDAHDPDKNNRMGLKANTADFDRFVGDIGVGLSLNGITTQSNKQIIDDLVALLYATKVDIVQR